MTIDATCRTKPTEIATKAGLKNVCFFLRAVRTECAKPREYRPSASLRRTTCMAPIIAPGAVPVCDNGRYRNEHHDLRWHHSIHRSPSFLERSRVRPRVD